jgi:hypothetical protein
MATTPTTELGGAGVIPVWGTGDPARGRFMGEPDPWDSTPELAWPGAAIVYDRMRKTDGQINAVLRAATLPILGTPWRLVGDDVPPEVVAFVESELGLGDPTDGRRRRRRQGVVWSEHLRMALLCLAYGFMPFEQVYTIDAPTPGAINPPGDLVAHLRKLAPRLPRTLSGPPRVDRDGGLAGITQVLPWEPTNTRTHPGGEVFIPADRLVLYALDREGADWTGNSLLRGAYKHWLIKDALLRLGPMICERNGMGVPVVTYADASQKTDALALGKGLRAGSESAAVVPVGVAVDLKGVTGSTRDELPLIKYHDEAAGRSALAMFLNLGHDNGARSLGETFVDFFTASLNAVAAQIASTATEHVVRDLVELNYGPDMPYPVLIADRINTESAPTADGLRTLADAGLLGPLDTDLQAEVRRRYGLPALPDVTDPAATNDPTLTDPSPTPPAGIVERLAALTDRVAAMQQAGLAVNQ